MSPKNDRIGERAIVSWQCHVPYKISVPISSANQNALIEDPKDSGEYNVQAGLHYTAQH